MPIENQQLIRLAGTTTYNKGYDYFEEGRVDLIKDYEDEVSARVAGSQGQTYEVNILFRDENWDEILDSVCNCPAYSPLTGMCKHVVATILEANDYQLFSDSAVGAADAYLRSLKAKSKPAQPKVRQTDRSGKELISQYANKIVDKSIPLEPITELATLECTLNLEAGVYYMHGNSMNLTFKMGAKKMYVLKNLQDFVYGFKYRESLKMGKNYTQQLVYEAFDPQCHAFIDFICENYGRIDDYYSSSKKMLYLDRPMLDDFISLMGGSKITVTRHQSRQRSYFVRRENPSLSLMLKDDKPGYLLSCTPFEGFVFGNKYSYVLKGDNLYQCDEDYTRACGSLLHAFAKEGQQYFALEDVPALLGSVIPEVRAHLSVDIATSAEDYMPEPLEMKVYFDIDEEDRVLAHMTHTYGEKTFDAFDRKYTSQSLDLASELKAEHLVSTYMGYTLVASGTLRQDDEEAIFQLVTEGFDRIEDVAEVYLSDDFSRIKVHAPVNVSVGIRIEGRLLEVDIDLEGLDYEELASVINSYRKAKRYHRLSDGSFLPLRDDALSQVVELGDALSLSAKDLESGHVSLDITRSLYLDAMLKQNEQIRYTRDGSFKEIVRRMNDVEDADYAVPQTLEETLRNYQVTGYLWLRTLHRLRFGGILADDMGLGKTLQVLALFSALKAEGELGTAIIVCPASLVYNWQAEANHFTPELGVCMVAGNARERAECIAQAAGYDVLVTSYDLLKRDIEQYKGTQFSYVVLDEAQYIKNQNTQSAKSVKLLDGAHRLALTGTPIENSLAELWSIFDFLMPGYLHAYKRFKQDFETPIVRAKDETTAERLRALVRPFILRRLKGDVLKELPEKIEQVHIAEMEGEQRKVYLATLAQSKKELATKLADAGSGQSRILVLAALTRLRQICCDPSLVYDEYKGDSAKLQLCFELIRASIDGGHRVVLFSQFTSMLAIIKDRLKEEGIGYHLLQGSTPKVERLRLVEQFNTGDVPIFLISLKAGGTGLNLTGADVVIHYDPWWNLSAQNQATDRTHRIGQTKHVQVFKLIAKDSVEEKILKLQEAKAELADKIIQKGDSVFDTLSSDELISLLEG